MIYKNLIRFGISLCLVLLVSACSSSSDDPKTNDVLDDSSGDNNTVNNAEIESGTDTDSNSDSDVDADSHTDSDTDVNSDTDADAHNDTDTNDNHLLIGSLFIDTSSRETYFEATFIDMNQSISEDIIEVELNQDRTTDRCEGEANDGTVVYGDRPDYMINVDLIEFINAGEVLTITGPEGTYTELQQNGDEFVSYTLPNEYSLEGPLPNNLSITVPGDVFPAFSDISIPNAQLVQLTSTDAASGFARDTLLTWVASDNPKSEIYLSLYYDNLYLDCWLVDDGEFEFPEGLKALVNADASSYITIYRETTNYVRQGNALFTVLTSAGVQ